MSPLALTALVSGTAIALVLGLGTWVAWSFAKLGYSVWVDLCGIVFLLPMVLPPTVVGFGLLLVLGRGTAFGRWLNDLAGIHLLFTWQGATVAAAVMAFPLYVRTAEASMRSVDQTYLEIGRISGASKSQLFWKIVLPLSIRGLLSGATLALARAIGEFGATMMVAGSIPGRTQTMPIALYEDVMAGENQEALRLALILTSVGLILLGSFSALQGHMARRNRI